MKPFNKSCYILIPTFNDWPSLNKLLREIDRSTKSLRENINVLIINDASTIKYNLKIKKLKKIKKIEIINLRKNFGSQISIGIGLNLLNKKKIRTTVLIIDSDGEDNPEKIPLLLNNLNSNRKKIIVASREKRKENIFLKFLNFLRLYFTLIFTGRFIDFGNFSCFDSSHLRKILSEDDLSLAFCATVYKNKKILKIPIKKNFRYFGKSKVSLINLFIYSLKLISIFKAEVLKRTLLITAPFLILFFFIKSYNYLILIFLISLLFNFLIFSLNQKKKNIEYYLKFIKKIIRVK